MSRLGLLNIDEWCLLIIITTSLMVNYCFWFIVVDGLCDCFFPF